MKKVFVSSGENKKNDQRNEEMRLKTTERWNLAFELIELALALSPNGKFPPPPNDSINWIELKFKDERNQRSS
jgi:hypothetical protein